MLRENVFFMWPKILKIQFEYHHYFFIYNLELATLSQIQAPRQKSKKAQGKFFNYIPTGEELLHKGWSSHNNLFGVLMETVTEFLENVTDLCGKIFYILGELT
jgi:hypothetical protein